MAERYVPADIEQKWRGRWEADGLYDAQDDDPRPKWYALTMFPYTSGDLHAGHWYAMAPSDVAARYRRMKGYNVMFPMGFDAFGLPAENAAIQRGIHPHVWTLNNVERMRGQLKTMGASFDWSREVITCLPEYYRWNQWFFLKLFEKGLAYRAKAPANWCPGCQTTLANEQVDQVNGVGVCERCKTPVTKRDLDQWFFRITQYADELLDFRGLQWPERVTAMQRNWIGKSYGVEVSFALDVPGVAEREIRVFTTRPDTLYGVTFMVLAPEHPLVPQLATPERRAEVDAYVEQARRATEIERQSTDREKTGVFLGSYCTNRVSGQRMPIWIADYALMHYGTGAVMAVPAHDTRDFEFAQKFGLEIIPVIAPPGSDPSASGGEPLKEAYVEPGIMVNSGPFNGVPSEEGKIGVAAYLEQQGWGTRTVSYRLRDWLISRQRYWGTPIPIVYCPEHGAVPVPERDLPVLLPDDAEFRPTGESPLKYHEAFVNTTCPQCGRPAQRETDTMDTFVDSSWYQLRYTSPHDHNGPFDPKLAQAWTPVDQYTGGAEHATMHLLYSRFFEKALRDLGLVHHNEPYVRLFNQGQILGPDGQRMSKSRGNVIAPDDQVARYGADTFRAYLMFLGPWDQGGPFNTAGISGISRWFNRVWNLVLDTWNAPSSAPNPAAVDELRRWTHRTIKGVTEDLEQFRFNTLLSKHMEFTNYLTDARDGGLPGSPAWREALQTLVLLVAPVAPHLAEELWSRIGQPYSVHTQAWPQWDDALTREQSFTLVIQVNGRVRDRVQAPVSITAEEAKALALQNERVRAQTHGRPPAEVIYVPGRLVNVVVR